jgi:hypothetical protein
MLNCFVFRSLPAGNKFKNSFWSGGEGFSKKRGDDKGIAAY